MYICGHHCHVIMLCAAVAEESYYCYVVRSCRDSDMSFAVKISPRHGLISAWCYEVWQQWSSPVVPTTAADRCSVPRHHWWVYSLCMFRWFMIHLLQNICDLLLLLSISLLWLCCLWISAFQTVNNCFSNCQTVFQWGVLVCRLSNNNVCCDF